MLGVITNKFSIGKETYQPHSAELHYFRIDKRYWAVCFERIKRAGFKIISTAVPWSVHMVDRATLDFSGTTESRRDLVVFLELAREFGFKVILRPGPRVDGQLENGGLPKYLFTDTKSLARNAAGREQELPSSFGVAGGYLPSYLHQNYQFHVKTYMKAFIEITKNYVHPRGPIFMVELDYETSYGYLLNPDSADYNPDVLAQFYPPFLEARYGDVKKIAAIYKEKIDTFAKVQPPKKFTDLDLKDYPKVLDWMRFREHMLNLYLNDMEDVFKSYTVEPLIFRSLYFKPGDLLPAFNLVPEDRSPFLSANVFPGGKYFDMMVKARYLQAEHGFAYASSFVSGSAAVDPARESKVAPVTDNVRRFYLAGSVAAGFRGLNHYMFVDRDHWYGAPLMNDGSLASGYELSRQFTTVMTSIGTETMDTKRDIAVVGNRLYSWLRLTESKKQFTNLNHILDESTVGFCRDLARLKLNFGVREMRDLESLKQYKLLFMPVTEVMSEKEQEGIVELAKAGVNIILCGLMPRYDENMHDCQVLANHFRIKTTLAHGISSITHKGGTFTSYVYGSIRSTDDGKVKKLLKAGTAHVGVCSNRFKGTLYFFSFDIASGGHHHKLAFNELILSSLGHTSYLSCSDPSVDMSFMCNDKRGLLFVVAPPPGELSDGYEAGKKHVIIQADLKETGFKSANLKLVDIFGGEEAEALKVTSKMLQDGIGIDIGFPDGKIFVVEKK